MNVINTNIKTRTKEDQVVSNIDIQIFDLFLEGGEMDDTA
jgi:hypothetical protein